MTSKLLLILEMKIELARDYSKIENTFPDIWFSLLTSSMGKDGSTHGTDTGLCVSTSNAPKTSIEACRRYGFKASSHINGSDDRSTNFLTS